MEKVTDVHIHVQPWRMLKPAVLDAMRRGKEARWEELLAVMEDPALLLGILDRAGIWRAGLVNYPSPDLMGFTDEVNEFVAEYASHDRERLIAIGGVHPRTTKSPGRDVDHLVDHGIRCLKIHPSHQGFPANAYTEGLDALRAIYARCEERGLPVMVHTGTSIFPGARSKWGNPMEVDDVAVDFPRLRIVMAHGGRPLWTREAFFLLRRHPNVWMDISSFPPQNLLEYFPWIAEVSDRVLWGTDWPSPGVLDMRANLDAFLALPLPDDVKRGVASGNALRLFPA